MNETNFEIAYFSAEIGISSNLPTYSGGLGVLAGDHIKASADAGLPMVAISLLYKEGYFKQRIDEDGVVGVFSFDGSSITSETVNNSNPSGTSYDGGGNQIAVFNLDNIGLPEIIVSQQDVSNSSVLFIYTSTS